MFVLKKLKSTLEKSDGYMRLRYSKFIHTFWLLWRKDVRDHIKSKQNFYSKVVGNKANLIFDVGSNEGMLTNIFSQLSNHVLAIEPSERNIKILQAKFHSNQSVLLLHTVMITFLTSEPVLAGDLFSILDKKHSDFQTAY